MKKNPHSAEAASPLTEEHLRQSGAKEDTRTHTSCRAGQAKAHSLGYSQRERNSGYKERKNKENQLDMREIKRQWFYYRHRQNMRKNLEQRTF